MENEIWKDIPEYEGLYQISNLGRIKSFSNKGPKAKNPFLSLYLGKRGYKYVVVSKNYNQKTLKIHRLIAQLFIPNPENKPQVNHKNGNKGDNRIENLEWCTPTENVNHAYRTGLASVGEKSTSSKLSNDAVKDIRENYTPKSYKYWTKKYNISSNLVYNIVNFKTRIYG